MRERIQEFWEEEKECPRLPSLEKQKQAKNEKIYQLINDIAEISSRKTRYMLDTNLGNENIKSLIETCEQNIEHKLSMIKELLEGKK